MEFKKLTIADLSGFIYSPEFRQFKNIPTTKHRAFSYINNPRSNPNDPVLYLAFDNNEIAGYRMVLPDQIYKGDKLIKTGWFSCVWVDPGKRGSGIAKKLVNEALIDWPNVVLQDPVQASKNLYLGTGYFSDPIALKGFRGFLKFNSSQIISAKFPKLKPITGGFRFIDKILNIGPEAILNLSGKYNKIQDIKIEFSNSLDSESKCFINSITTSLGTRRRAQEIEWIIKNPWVIQAPQKDNDGMRYHFSSSSKLFYYLIVKIFSNNSLLGVIILSIRDNHVKTPYAYFSETHTDLIGEVIESLLVKIKPDVFTTFHPILKKYFNNNKSLFIYTKVIQRQYLISKILRSDLGEFNQDELFEDGDGDAAFT